MCVLKSVSTCCAHGVHCGDHPLRIMWGLAAGKDCLLARVSPTNVVRRFAGQSIHCCGVLCSVVWTLQKVGTGVGERSQVSFKPEAGPAHHAGEFGCNRGRQQGPGFQVRRAGISHHQGGHESVAPLTTLSGCACAIFALLTTTRHNNLHPSLDLHGMLITLRCMPSGLP